MENREGKRSAESFGKPDAMKVARPVWGWGRGEIPRPTPQVQEVDQLRYIPRRRVRRRRLAA